MPYLMEIRKQFLHYSKKEMSYILGNCIFTTIFVYVNSGALNLQTLLCLRTLRQRLNWLHTNLRFS